MKLIGRWLVLLMAAFGCAVVVVVIASWKPADAAEEPAPAAAAPVSAEPDHYYSFVDGTQYGYQPVLSLADRQAGQAAAPLVMFRYHGVRNGRTQLGSNLGGGVSQVMDCTEPCDTVRIRLFSGWREIKREYLALTPGIIAGMAMSDARRGKMKLHQNREGKYVFFGESRSEMTLFDDAAEVSSR